MDIKTYISSGIIEDYCLGILSEKEQQEVELNASMYPLIKSEITAYQQVLEKYAADFAESVSPALKQKTQKLLDNLSLEEAHDISKIPILNKYADSNNWLSLVKPLLPSQLKDDMFVHVLQDTEEVEQLLIWTKVDYPDEVHTLEKECFMILEGECECYIGDNKIIHLSAGGFIDIPMYEHHDVKVVKGPVLAIVQRLKKAA
jgi:mannose-6-phosphate isomerase-like protein (cupin superfamily)